MLLSDSTLLAIETYCSSFDRLFDSTFFNELSFINQSSSVPILISNTLRTKSQQNMHDCTDKSYNRMNLSLKNATTSETDKKTKMKTNSIMKTKKDLSWDEKIALSFPSLNVLTMNEFNWKWNLKNIYVTYLTKKRNSWDCWQCDRENKKNQMLTQMQAAKKDSKRKERRKIKTVWSHFSFGPS